MASGGEVGVGDTHTVGKIKIFRDAVLGRGAFGVVYKGEFGGRKVAVKRIVEGKNVERERLPFI